MIKSASQSSLTNDVKYRNMGAANVPSNEYLIETITVGATPVASVTFNNLSQWAGIYRHLQICLVTRGTNATNAWETGFMRFNGDTGSNYAWHLLSGTGSSVLSENGTSRDGMIAQISAGAKLPTGIFSPGTIDILDPFLTSKNTTIRHLSGSDRPLDNEQRVSLGSGAWFNTAAVTSITLFAQGGNWATGSRFSLYGVTA